MISDAELKTMQNYPLELKILKTKQRIREWYEHYNGDVYVSFSGGKDSTVLLHIAREMYPDIEAVYSDTGLEYPEVRQFVKSFENVTFVKPKKTFKQVLDEHGYPVISKSVANCVRLAKKNIADGKDTLRVRQIKGLEKGSKFNKGHYEYLLDAPFKISEECCVVFKKEPMKRFKKETGKRAIIATLADEGGVRREAYKMSGCNSFKSERSQPLGFWTEQDILTYIVTRNLRIAPVYGDIVEVDGKYVTTKEQRTGCLFCMFGAHLEKSPNRFERMKQTHPQLHDYCINKLNLKQVLDYVKIRY